MATPSTINPQIADSITQTNTKVIAEAPAMAAATLYQSLVHSIGILFENAVAAQQQQNIVALAASNQGIMQIYTVDTTAAAGASQRPSTSPETLQAHTQQATAAAKSAFATTPGVDSQIEAAVKLANDAVFGNASDIAYAIRAGVDTMTAALQSVGKALHDDLMRTLQMAATAAVLEAMLRDPSKSAEYGAVLRVIKRME